MNRIFNDASKIDSNDLIIEIDQLVNQITSLQRKSAENDIKVFKEFFDASLWRLEELKKERAIFNGKKKDLIDFLAVKIMSKNIRLKF